MKSFNFNLEDVRRQFLDFMKSLGVQPHNETDIILDGELHRYRVHDDKGYCKSGAYLVHSDGWPAGFVQDWRTDIKQDWKYDISALPEERRSYFNSEEYRKKCELEHEKAEKKRAYRRSVQTEKARQLWNRLTPAPDNHPYLLRKHIKPWGIAFNPNTNCLAVPLRDINSALQSIQWIPAEEEKHKLFFEGAEMKGAFFSYELSTIDYPENYNSFILIGEGYATMIKLHELTGYPVVAAMSCFRLHEVAAIIRKAFPKAKLIITADNDHETLHKRGFNPGVSYAESTCKKLGIGAIAPDFLPDEHGSDWDDYALLHGDNEAAARFASELQRTSIPQSIKNMEDTHRLQSINAQDLRLKHFDPIKWAVPGLIPSGLSILGGGPKVGKSIFALNIGVGVAIGGCVLGKIQLEQGDALYLALEDNERRLQDRIISIPFLAETDDIRRLTLVTVIPRQNEGGMEFLQWWLEEHKASARLVIIDTLQKFRKQLSGKGNIYAEDYDVISELKTLADKFDVAILVIHHLKKMSAREEKSTEPSGDWVNSFSGSVGISGSADALFIIKRDRTCSSGKMFRTGRDVEEAEFNLRLDGIGWYLDGEAESFTLPTWQKQILDFIKEHGSVTPSELAAGYDLNINTAKGNLHRMEKEGRIRKTNRGKYELNPDYSK